MNSRGHCLRHALSHRPRPLQPPAARAYGSQRHTPGPNWPGSTRGSANETSQTLVARRPARRRRLEAVLFLAREPLSLRKLAQSANLADATEARTLIVELRRLYDQRGSAFQLEQLAGGYQLRTRPKFAPWLRPLVGSEEQLRLSPPALETLAVVAYRQPVLRADVEAIRGVACGEILRQLMDRDLLRIVGRSEELGRPLWYGTTRRFLEAFGLSSLDELPLADVLRRAANESENASRGAENAAGGIGHVDAA